MKASKFSDAQKAFILKQGEEGTPVAEICPNPVAEGVWQGGGVGFRWEEGIPMRN